jgi:copper(I)-binding protein
MELSELIVRVAKVLLLAADGFIAGGATAKEDFMNRPGHMWATLIAACLGVAVIGASPAMAAEDADAEAVEEEISEADEAAAAAIAEARANISLTNAWTRATPGNATNAAVYLRIGNIGEEAERLIGVRSEMSERVMIHSGGGQMARIESLDIPGEDAIAFEPNGNHIMLMDLRAPLLEEDSFLVQLEFERGGSQTVSVQVLAANAVGPSALGAVNTPDAASEAEE